MTDRLNDAAIRTMMASRGDTGAFEPSAQDLKDMVRKLGSEAIARGVERDEARAALNAEREEYERGRAKIYAMQTQRAADVAKFQQMEAALRGLALRVRPGAEAAPWVVEEIAKILAAPSAEYPKPSASADSVEAAFWEFDARRKGYAEWAGAPQSERDAFKATIATLTRERHEAPAALSTEREDHCAISVENRRRPCEACGSTGLSWMIDHMETCFGCKGTGTRPVSNTGGTP